MSHPVDADAILDEFVGPDTLREIKFNWKRKMELKVSKLINKGYFDGVGTLEAKACASCLSKL